MRHFPRNVAATLLVAAGCSCALPAPAVRIALLAPLKRADGVTEDHQLFNPIFIATLAI